MAEQVASAAAANPLDVAMKVVRAIAHDQGHKQTLCPSAGRSPGALINAIREVLHAEMMRGDRRDSTTRLLERRV